MLSRGMYQGKSRKHCLRAVLAVSDGLKVVESQICLPGQRNLLPVDPEVFVLGRHLALRIACGPLRTTCCMCVSSVVCGSGKANATTTKLK